MIAADLMDTDAPTLSPDDDLPTAAELLTRYEHSAVPVVNHARLLVGVVSESDLLSMALPAGGAFVDHLRYLPKCYGLRSLASEQLRQVKVAQVMQTTDIVTVAPEDPAAEVALLMLRHNLSQLPVVSQGTLLGRVCRKRIINQLVNPSLGVTCDPWA